MRRMLLTLALAASALAASAGDLPDPLTMADGSPVRTPDQWYGQRRPELKDLIQRHVYGYLPPAGRIEAKVTKTVPLLLGGKATLKEVEISFPEMTCDTPPVIHLALFLPSEATNELRDCALATDQVPVFLGLYSAGTHTLLPDERLTLRPAADPAKTAARGASTETWCVEQLIDRGYGLAVFDVADVDPDDADLTNGLHACLKGVDADGNPVPKGAEPGTIAAWAWGLHRAVDYLVTDPAVNPKQIAVIGHSRRGKTALLAGAFDERIALVVPHQSGTGGMALSRGNDQETVARINKNFPHWFADNFNEFNDNEDALPVDQHLLAALVAPRPLLDTAGLQDKWANYDSASMTLRAADPVYEFLGSRGLVGDGVLSAGTPITAANAGDLLQYRLDKKHVLDRDYWTVILDFADLKFGHAATAKK